MNLSEWNSKCKRAKCESFKIYVNFIVGRAGNDILPFDSVISYFAMRYLLGKEIYNLHSKDWIEIEIPVKKEGPFYHIGSILEIPNIASFWVKRFEKRYLNSVDSNIVRTGTGKFKNYLQPIMYSTKKNYTVFGAGDIGMLKEIIPERWFLGKKTASGYGECMLSVSESNNADVLFQDGILQKHIPVEYLKHLNPKKATIRMLPCAYPYYGPHAKRYNCFEAGGEFEVESET